MRAYRRRQSNQFSSPLGTRSESEDNSTSCGQHRPSQARVVASENTSELRADVVASFSVHCWLLLSDGCRPDGCIADWHVDPISGHDNSTLDEVALDDMLALEI